LWYNSHDRQPPKDKIGVLFNYNFTITEVPVIAFLLHAEAGVDFYLFSLFTPKSPYFLSFFGVKLISLRLLIFVPQGFQDNAISS